MIFLQKADHLPQNLMPLPYQQNPSTFSSTLNPVVVTDDLITQVVSSSAHEH